MLYIGSGIIYKLRITFCATKRFAFRVNLTSLLQSEPEASERSTSLTEAVAAMFIARSNYNKLIDDSHSSCCGGREY